MKTIKAATDGTNIVEVLYYAENDAYQLRINNLYEYYTKEEVYKLFDKAVKHFSLQDYIFTFEKLSISEAKWYGSSEPCYIVRYASGFAPLNKYASVINGKYADNKSTGYIHGKGNLGTASMLLKDITLLNLSI